MHDMINHFSWLFTMSYHDMSGKQLKHCMVILPGLLFLPSSSKYPCRKSRLPTHAFSKIIQITFSSHIPQTWTLYSAL